MAPIWGGSEQKLSLARQRFVKKLCEHSPAIGLRFIHLPCGIASARFLKSGEANRKPNHRNSPAMETVLVRFVGLTRRNGGLSRLNVTDKMKIRLQTNRLRIRDLLLGLFVALAAAALRAGDWPQY